MTTTNDGGPAFPIPGAGTQDGLTGMTLRDWFAGHALSGIIGNSSDAWLRQGAMEAVRNFESDTSQTHARWAYDYADAMLAERERKP